MSINTHKSIGLSPVVHDYLVRHSYRPNQYLDELFQATFRDERSQQAARMCSPPDSTSFLQMMVKLSNAKSIIEVGTFTGFTALAMALALPEDGKLITLDINDSYASVGRPVWEKAGVDSRISLILGPAAESLETLVKTKRGTVDMMFIDADKGNYGVYYDYALELLRPGGVLLIDNVLWGGKVADPSVNTPDTLAIRAVNDKAYADPRVDMSMLPISDGVTVVRKK